MLKQHIFALCNLEESQTTELCQLLSSWNKKWLKSRIFSLCKNILQTRSFDSQVLQLTPL